MKKLLLIPVLALLLVGCSSIKSTVTPALVQSSVSASVRFGVAKYPTARPAVQVGVEVICSQANGTNISPAVIAAAVEASPYASLKTPEAVFIMQAVISAYSIAWNSFGAEAVSNSTAVKPYLQAVCSGGTEGLSTSLSAARSAEASQWPQLKFPQ